MRTTTKHSRAVRAESGNVHFRPLHRSWRLKWINLHDEGCWNRRLRCVIFREAGGDDSRQKKKLIGILGVYQRPPINSEEQEHRSRTNRR